MNKNYFHLFFLLFFGLILSLSSCKKNDPVIDLDAPTIDLTEVGSENSHTVYAGADLHLEADIQAGGMIQKIDIKIQQKQGGDFNIVKSYNEGKYIGVKTVEFHEHLSIPADAPVGEYQLQFAVTDKAGKITTVSADLTIDVRGAKVTALQVGEKDDRNNAMANVFRKLYIGASLTSNVEIVSIAFSAKQRGVEAGKTLEAKELIGSFNKETGKLDAAIDIPLVATAGDYEMSLLVKDAEGIEVKVLRNITVNDKPAIEDFEVGSGHGQDERTDYKGYIGTDLHIEGQVFTVKNRLKSIIVKIKQDVAENPYTIVAPFNKETNYFAAVARTRNNTFHEHIDLPANMPVGTYKFSFLVEDEAGQTFEKTATISLVKQ